MYHALALLVNFVAYLLIVGRTSGAMQYYESGLSSRLGARNLLDETARLKRREDGPELGGLDEMNEVDAFGENEMDWDVDADAETFRKRGRLPGAGRYLPDPLMLLRRGLLRPRKAKASPMQHGPSFQEWPQDFEQRPKSRPDDKTSVGGSLRSFDVVDPDSKAGEDNWAHLTGGTHKSTEQSKSQKQNEPSHADTDRDQSLREGGHKQGEGSTLGTTEGRAGSRQGGLFDQNKGTTKQESQEGKPRNFEVQGQKHGMRIGKFFMDAVASEGSNAKASKTRKKQQDAEGNPQDSKVEQKKASSPRRPKKQRAPFLRPPDGWQKVPDRQKIHDQQMDDAADADVSNAGRKKKVGSLKDHAKFAQLIGHGLWKKFSSNQGGP